MKAKNSGDALPIIGGLFLLFVCLLAITGVIGFIISHYSTSELLIPHASYFVNALAISGGICTIVVLFALA